MAQVNGQPQDPQKAYLNEKLSNLTGQIGEGYGEPLLEELMSRLEKTVADFHEEVTEMLVDLKKRSQERQDLLKQRWAGQESDGGGKEADAAPAEEEPAEEASDWEKRLEEKEAKSGGKKEAPTEEEDKPKKKGFFKRKKKKKE